MRKSEERWPSAICFLMDFHSCLQKPCATDAPGFRTVPTAPAADLDFRKETEREPLKDARSSAVRADFGNTFTMVRRARGELKVDKVPGAVRVYLNHQPLETWSCPECGDSRVLCMTPSAGTAMAAFGHLPVSDDSACRATTDELSGARGREW